MEKLPSHHRPAIDKFAEAARTFLTWCETAHSPLNAAAFKHEALRKLADIYAAGFLLPDVEFSDSPEFPRVSAEQRKSIASNLLGLPFQYYWTVFTPSDLEGDRTPVCGDLFDDFEDIYGDLRNGLAVYHAGYAEAAAFDWRQMFEAHWGRHAVEAMQALHSYDADK